MNHNPAPVLYGLSAQNQTAGSDSQPTSETVPTPTAHQLRLHAPDHEVTPTVAAPTPVETQDAVQAHEDAAAIVDGLLKTAHRLRGVLSDYFAEFDLSDVRYSVLRLLADSEPQGCTQADVAVHLDQSESSISMLIKRMRNSELLFRLRSTDDKRKWVLQLTNRGRELLQKVQDCHARRMGELLCSFSEAERASLVSHLDKLQSVLATSSLIEEDDSPLPLPAPSNAVPSPLSDASPAA